MTVLCSPQFMLFALNFRRFDVGSITSGESRAASFVDKKDERLSTMANEEEGARGCSQPHVVVSARGCRS